MTGNTAVNVRRVQDKYSASYAGLKSGRPGMQREISIVSWKVRCGVGKSGVGLVIMSNMGTISLL